MCFGSRQPQMPNIQMNVPPPSAPLPPPSTVSKEYRPLTSESARPAIQAAGTAERRRSKTPTRRKSLSSGLSTSGGASNSGGINI